MSSQRRALKPCPFCGGEADRAVQLLPGTGMYYECLARCRRCGAEIKIRYHVSEWIKDAEKEAKRYIAAMWNRRTGYV